MKTHAKFDPRKTAIQLGQKHTVNLPWVGQNNFWWNEACADIMEVFGLPGDRYTSHATMMYMTFYFKSEKDKVLCEILLSEHLSKSQSLVLHS